LLITLSIAQLAFVKARAKGPFFFYSQRKQLWRRWYGQKGSKNLNSITLIVVLSVAEISRGPNKHAFLCMALAALLINKFALQGSEKSYFSTQLARRWPEPWPAADTISLLPFFL
jgi:hypothetical protein